MLNRVYQKYWTLFENECYIIVDDEITGICFKTSINNRWKSLQSVDVSTKSRRTMFYPDPLSMNYDYKTIAVLNIKLLSRISLI